MRLAVVKVLGLCAPQDHGRIGRMHEGLPHGGPLVPSLLARANRAVANPDDTTGIEILGKLIVRAEGAIDLSVDGSTRTLRAGEELAIESEPRRVAYVAIRGGVKAPIVLGSASTHLSAGLGRALRTGDAIDVDAIAPALDAHALPEIERDAPIRVILGPDGDAFASALGETYRISPTSDRIGTRLDGARIVRRDMRERSRPMVRGAIEVPGDGMPIVLGPEHPTTGGYPVIGVIASADLDRFFAIRLGGTVRFTASDSHAPANRRA
jgi:5-oxoprolinase (ATP-hydrolysing) subunit C